MRRKRKDREKEIDIVIIKFQTLRFQKLLILILHIIIPAKMHVAREWDVVRNYRLFSHTVLHGI